LIDGIFSIFLDGRVFYLLIAASLAGVVRGFSGFGSAMIFIPIAGQVLRPVEVIIVLTIMDLIGPLPNIPKAIRDSRLREVFLLVFGGALTLPVGVFLLTLMSVNSFKLIASTFTLILLCLLVLGVRYRKHLNKYLIFFTGALGGLFGGAVGIPGPPVIMLYMASELPPRVIRANNMIYLFLIDILLVFIFMINGMLILNLVGLGLLVSVPYLIANTFGGLLFRPNLEKFYRIIAYVIIFCSALLGLPFF